MTQWRCKVAAALASSSSSAAENALALRRYVRASKLFSPNEKRARSCFIKSLVSSTCCCFRSVSPPPTATRILGRCGASASAKDLDGPKRRRCCCLSSWPPETSRGVSSRLRLKDSLRKRKEAPELHRRRKRGGGGCCCRRGRERRGERSCGECVHAGRLSLIKRTTAQTVYPFSPRDVVHSRMRLLAQKEKRKF